MLQHDIGAYIASRFGAKAEAVAAGAGDNTEVNGPYFAHEGFLSAKLIIAYECVLQAAATLSLAHNLQDATTIAGAGVADFGAVTALTVRATGDTGGSTERGVVEVDYDLTTARGFLRVQVTPDLSAGGTDTADVIAIVVLGGADTLPAV